MLLCCYHLSPLIIFKVLDDDRRDREASGLVRTGRIFGGLIDDIKRKKKHYISDFKDGLHPQCISSFLYLYIANLAPIIAFGALLGKTTHKQIATIEGLVAGLLSGVLFSLFAGQPLNLLGSTGPVYVFEKILFELCETNEWNYLSLRLWIGVWVTIILLLLVAFDASALVCYITRSLSSFLSISQYLSLTDSLRRCLLLLLPSSLFRAPSRMCSRSNTRFISVHVAPNFFVQYH